MKARISIYLAAVILIMGITLGCNKAPNDAQITSEIQNQLNADSGLQGKQLSVQSSEGVVTLSGNVDNDGQRDAATRYASSTKGVKTVVNNLQVVPPQEAAQKVPPPDTKPASIEPLILKQEPVGSE